MRWRVIGERMENSNILGHGTRWGGWVSDSRLRPFYSFNEWLCGPQSQSERSGEHKNLLTLRESNLRRPAPSQLLLIYAGQHKHRINTHIHPWNKWDSNPRSQCSSRRRQFMS
jgi:hypothetical protein